MKNIEVLNLFQGLDSLKDLSGVKFTYGVMRNREILKPIFNSIVEAEKIKDEKVEKLNEEIRKLAIEHAKKDEKGNAIVENGTIVLENVKDLNKKIEKLKEEDEESFKMREKHLEAYNEFLLEELKEEPEFFLIDLEDVPETITHEQMKIIYPLIKVQ